MIPIDKRRDYRSLLIARAANVLRKHLPKLDRNASRDVALMWKESLKDVGGLSVLGCSEEDVELAWSYFDRRDLHKLWRDNLDGIRAAIRMRLLAATAS